MHATRDSTTATVSARMTFANPGSVEADHMRTGRLRFMRSADGTKDEATHFCRVHDWSATTADRLDFDQMGFDTISLESLSELQASLETVRRAGHITLDDANIIRHQLQGQEFRLSCGKRLRLLNVAAEGLIFRKAGPNGRRIDPDEPMTGMNGHDGAQMIHADQDVTGTPLRQLMHGTAPYLFRHESPGIVKNRLSPVVLINLWIPLQQLTRPLCLMDRRSLDKRRHQLCYALPTDGFLDREAALSSNDIWTFLHDENQRWYFGSAMDAKSAYIFDTLGTPHGAMILPGEEAAEILYLRLTDAIAAIRAGNEPALPLASEQADLPPDTPQPLRHAVTRMAELLAAATAGSSNWLMQAEQAADSLVRKSIELRAVALTLPDIWPLNRI